MNDRKQVLQSLSLVIVSALLILTAWGNASLMFWSAVAAMVAVLFLFSAERNTWMSALAGIFVAVAIVIYLF